MGVPLFMFLGFKRTLTTYYCLGKKVTNALSSSTYLYSTENQMDEEYENRSK